jgi:hypothetical protein
VDGRASFVAALQASMPGSLRLLVQLSRENDFGTPTQANLKLTTSRWSHERESPQALTRCEVWCPCSAFRPNEKLRSGRRVELQRGRSPDGETSRVSPRTRSLISAFR